MSVSDSSSYFAGSEEWAEDWEIDEAEGYSDERLPAEECAHCRHARRSQPTEYQLRATYLRRLKKLRRELETLPNTPARRLREVVLRHKIEMLEDAWPTVYRRIPNSRLARSAADPPPTGVRFPLNAKQRRPKAGRNSSENQMPKTANRTATGELCIHG